MRIDGVMTRSKSVLLFVSVVMALFGCGGEEKYPSTTTVKIEALEPGGDKPQEPISSDVFQSQASIIKSSLVLRKAASGTINKVLWTVTGTPGDPQLSTEELIETRLPDLISGDAGYGLKKEFIDAIEGRVPLRIALAKRTGRKKQYLESEAVKILAPNLEVKVEERAALINITYYSDDATEAKTVADMIAAAYISFLDEDNARKIEKMIEVAAEYRKARAGLPGAESVSELRDKLSKIQIRYKLQMDEEGNFERPSEIADKEKEKTSLRPKIVQIGSTLKRLQGIGFDDQVRFLSLKGYEDVRAQRENVSSLDIEIKSLKIDRGENETKEQKEKRKAEIEEKQRELEAAESKLNQSVTTIISELEQDLKAKRERVENLENEIKQLEDDFFTGTAEYKKVARKLESAKKSISYGTSQDVAFGTFLNASIFVPAEISTGTVKRPGVWNVKMIMIGVAIGLAVVLNVVFILFMVRWAKGKRKVEY